MTTTTIHIDFNAAFDFTVEDLCPDGDAPAVITKEAVLQLLRNESLEDFFDAFDLFQEMGPLQVSIMETP